MVVGRSADVAGWRGEHRQRVSRVGDRRGWTGGGRCGATAPAAAPCQRFPQSPRLGSRRYRLSRLRLLPVHHPRRRRQRRTAWPPAGDAPRPMRRRRRAMHTRAVPLPRTQPLPGAIYTLAPPPHPTTVTRHLCGRGWSRGNGWQQRCKAFAVSFARLIPRGGHGWTARRPTPPPLAPPTGAARGVSPSPRPRGGAPTRACTPSMGARWRLAHRVGGAGEQTCRAGAVWAAANLCIARWGGGGDRRGSTRREGRLARGSLARRRSPPPLPLGPSGRASAAAAGRRRPRVVNPSWVHADRGVWLAWRAADPATLSAHAPRGRRPTRRRVPSVVGAAAGGARGGVIIRAPRPGRRGGRARRARCHGAAPVPRMGRGAVAGRDRGTPSLRFTPDRRWGRCRDRTAAARPRALHQDSTPAGRRVRSVSTGGGLATCSGWARAVSVQPDRGLYSSVLDRYGQNPGAPWFNWQTSTDEYGHGCNLVSVRRLGRTGSVRTPSRAGGWPRRWSRHGRRRDSQGAEASGLGALGDPWL